MTSKILNTQKPITLKNRKERIIYLIKSGQLNHIQLSKILNCTPSNLLASIQRKKEINSLKFIIAVNKALNHQISYQWIITGQPPLTGIPPERKFDFNKHIKHILETHDLNLTTISKTFGINRTHLHRVFNQPFEKIKIHHIILIHLLTGLSFDYIISGTGKKYIWENNNHNFIDDIVHTIQI